MADPGGIGGKYLTAFYSSCALARLGPICQIAIHRTRHAIAAFNIGFAQVSSGVCWRDWPKIYAFVADSILRKPSSMEALPRQKKGGAGVGKTKRGKGTKIMAVADGTGLPVAVCAESATPHEVTLVQQTLSELFIAEPIERLIGDNAYDSDRLDRELADTGVEMIAPHRSNRKNRTQDRRALRRYRRRWKVERLFAWLQNFRRLTTRWEHRLDNFLGMLHLACELSLLRYL